MHYQHSYPARQTTNDQLGGNITREFENSIIRVIHNSDGNGEEETRIQDNLDAQIKRDFPMDESWDKTMTVIQEKWDVANFDTWLKDARFKSECDDKYIIAVSNSYVCDTLQYRMYDDVKIALSEVLGRDMSIEFWVDRRL